MDMMKLIRGGGVEGTCLVTKRGGGGGGGVGDQRGFLPCCHSHNAVGCPTHTQTGFWFGSDMTHVGSLRGPQASGIRPQLGSAEHDRVQ